MDTHPTAQTLGIAPLALACARAQDVDALVSESLPLLTGLAQGAAALVLQQTAEGPRPMAAAPAGIAVQAPDVSTVAESEEWSAVELPEGWAAHGVRRALARTLPGHLVLVLGWADAAGEPTSALAEGAELLVAALRRLDAEHRLTDLAARVDNAQRLANMGDYDWHIASDTNTWSDQLFRIYGHEPGAFNPSYARFLEMIHPEDRDRISGIHQEAYASGEPYQMVERIVRPDGEVRYLSSNGQVVRGEDGTPVRMRGTCVDITDRVVAEQERERSTARFRGLVEASPDAIVVVDDAGVVVQTNTRAGDLVGGDLVGQPLTTVIPGDVAEHGAQGVEATAVDGRSLTLDVVAVRLAGLEGEELRAVFLHDSGPRLRGEALAAGLREAEIRRRQALEINDNLVQGLTAAIYSLDEDSPFAARDFMEQTLSAARRMMDDLLAPLDGEGLDPGDLIRSHASRLHEGPGSAARPVVGTPPVEPAERGGRRRVLVVDDYEDIRLLLRLKLEGLGFEVVDEAGDGEEAVRLARVHQPDLVLLDVAMPRMDGLQALPLIREAAEGAKVVVLSGFDQDTMAERAREAGADHYVEKGRALADLVAVIEDLAGG